MSTIYGKELILDLIQCNKKIIDAIALREFVQRLCELIEMIPYGEINIKHFGHNDENTAGYTFVQLIETSSLIGHISEKNKSIHINIFSCKEFNVFNTTAFTINYFNAIVKSQLLIERVY